MKTEYMIRGQINLVLAALMPQNSIVMKVALHTGLRLSDILCIKTSQLSKSRFWVTERKTGKRRQVGLPAVLRAEVLSQAGEIWAFPGRSGKKPRTRQAVWADVKRVARALRFPQNIAPHSARKVYAVRLLEKYGAIARVRRELNHSSDSVTVIYALADHMVSQKYPQLDDGHLTGKR